MNTRIEPAADAIALDDAALETVNAGFAQFLVGTIMSNVFSGISEGFGGSKVDGKLGFIVKGGAEIARKLSS
ncbi:MAG: hypothetical protein B7Y84_04635 [Azorhizobium sp. 32-67-21]|nr:MAG: hypothetical protein B7Z30_10435 [Rhizobiales bacterium 12-68-15]OYX89557.1 MAG: hypothetical protein B7Y84_04635 [Azorhizobium sp. 32-67-21]